MDPDRRRLEDKGRLEGKRAEIHVTGFLGGAAVCGRITGWFRYIGALSGAGSLRSRHERCASRGHDERLRVFDRE